MNMEKPNKKTLWKNTNNHLEKSRYSDIPNYVKRKRKIWDISQMQERKRKEKD
jgi:hypothetical protein